MWSDFNNLAIIRKECEFHDILIVFSDLSDGIELIPFWVGQVSCDTSLDTQQQVNQSNLSYPPLGDPYKVSKNKKNIYLKTSYICHSHKIIAE